MIIVGMHARWNRALWADNMFLAGKLVSAQEAATAYTTALRDWGMECKEGGLDMMVRGTQYTDTVTDQIGSRTIPRRFTSIHGCAEARPAGPNGILCILCADALLEELGHDALHEAVLTLSLIHISEPTRPEPI
eukprot:146012-Pyramimonas_sp.AAC.1